jgi:hypothetical protein
MPTSTTTATGQPLELLGTHAGVSIVDPATLLTRLWYFDGKFLRAVDLRRDQDYVRALVALSNQAGGRGVVHGFDIALAGGDKLRVEGGLAVAPSGRIVYLPQQVDVSIAQLVARSTGTFDPSTPGAPAGPPDFSPCPPAGPGGPDVVAAGRPLYLLTVAPVEALCGEEERFGQLCEDACAAETDRSTVVEGVLFRVRELTLALPESATVPFAPVHLRSRVASAYFAQERKLVPSMISGAGLANRVWCAGAEGIGGDEVALAVLDRAGAVTSLLDTWTARREPVETTPARYWAGRLAMRPWDVFLAQVLQFQCQLLDLGADGGGPGGPVDPCADKRGVLAAADELLGELSGISPDALSRIAVLRTRIAASLSGFTVSPSGSLLLDGGIVETPPAGYLPVRLDRDVADQVRALFGPGVDLRFCAVRPDFVPEALIEAQHMDRISLTQGLDDPGAREEVDVLVPGGRLVDEGAVATPAFTGVVRIHPRVRAEGDGPAEGSALSFSAVARDTTAAGWSWSLAAYGEASRRLSMLNLARATFPVMGLGGAEGEEVPLFIRPDVDHDAIRGTAAFGQRLLRESRLSAARKARLAARPDLRPEPDRELADGEDRPVVLWIDVATAVGLDQVATGGRTDGRLRLTLYSRAAGAAVLADIRATGSIAVQEVVAKGDVRDIRTLFDGVATTLFAGAGREDDVDTRPLQVPLRWRVRRPAGTTDRILRVVAMDPPRAGLALVDTGSPRHLEGELFEFERIPDRPEPLRARPTVVTPGWAPRPSRLAASLPAAAAAPAATVASLEMDEDATALTVGSPSRALGESVIAVIGAEMSVPGRDPAFTAQATERLLGGVGRPGRKKIEATADWVMFHRRRTITCADEAPERPLRTRTYRLFHRRLDDRDLKPFDALGGVVARSADELPGIDVEGLDPAVRRALRGLRVTGFVRGSVAVDQLGFEPVATLEFPEGLVELDTPVSVLRSSWQAGDRGTTIVLAAVGDIGEGDGETVALGRLATVRSALADLADSSGARVQYLAEIPPEFREPGLDGAMFTVGTSPQPNCVEFESLELGSEFPTGTSFSEGDVIMTMQPFVFSNGEPTSDGFGRIDEGGSAGGSGKELRLNNANVAFDWGEVVTEVSCRVGEYGGNLNLEVNGESWNFQDFSALPGTSLGNVDVSAAVEEVTTPGSGERGTIKLVGPVTSFSVGGQELWIDDVCAR